MTKLPSLASSAPGERSMLFSYPVMLPGAEGADLVRIGEELAQETGPVTAEKALTKLKGRWPTYVREGREATRTSWRDKVSYLLPALIGGSLGIAACIAPLTILFIAGLESLVEAIASGVMLIGGGWGAWCGVQHYRDFSLQMAQETTAEATCLHWLEKIETSQLQLLVQEKRLEKEPLTQKLVGRLLERRLALAANDPNAMPPLDPVALAFEGKMKQEEPRAIALLPE